jgi:hypothetical protein
MPIVHELKVLPIKERTIIKMEVLPEEVELALPPTMLTSAGGYARSHGGANSSNRGAGRLSHSLTEALNRGCSTYPPTGERIRGMTRCGTRAVPGEEEGVGMGALGFHQGGGSMTPEGVAYAGMPVSTAFAGSPFVH